MSLLSVRDKVTRQCPQAATTFEEKVEPTKPGSNRGQSRVVSAMGGLTAGPNRLSHGKCPAMSAKTIASLPGLNCDSETPWNCQSHH